VADTVSDRPKGQLLQGVQRACRILQLLAQVRQPLSPVDISRALGINLATCYHLLNTLQHEGFLRRDSARRLFLGERIGQLHDALQAMLGPDEELVEILEELNRKTGETSYLGTWDGDEVVSVAVREGRRGVQVRPVHLGYRRHAYARALGRALLAYRDDEFIASFLELTDLEPLTERTTTDPKSLRSLLAEVERTGIAVEREEFTRGVCCAAAPIFYPGGRALAAYSVSVPVARFESEGESIIVAVEEHAAKATERLAERERGGPEPMRRSAQRRPRSRHRALA
jgi:IclR family transcriptional regulator, acetate operon repressor